MDSSMRPPVLGVVLPPFWGWFWGAGADTETPSALGVVLAVETPSALGVVLGASPVFHGSSKV